MVTPLAKSVFALLGLIATTSGLVSGIQKEILGLGTAISVTSNEDLEDILRKG